LVKAKKKQVLLPARLRIADTAPAERSLARAAHLADLEGFLYDHRPHGSLTADAIEPVWNGYLLTVACPCGVVFERWITPGDAELNLVRAASLN
jgi:hypothetical protein